MNWGYNAPRKRKYNRFWSSGKLAQAIREQKERGTDYLVQKYGQARVNQISSKIEKAHATPGRGKTGGRVQYGRLKGRKIGNAFANTPSKATVGDWLKSNKVGSSYARVGFRDGGPGEVIPNSNPLENFEPGNFAPRMKLNLENDEELAQGSQHEWAMPTSISSTITGLLRQAQNSAPNFWDQFFSNKPGQYALDGRPSSSFGVDARYTQTPAGQTTNFAGQPQGPAGAFGLPGGLPGQFPAQAPPAPGPTPQDPQQAPEDQQAPPPPFGEEDPILGDQRTHSGPLYNPWAFGQGGDTNAYGPSQAYMGNATMEAMALANAYFAPQRMELAYELGDMETDMRRLAVNLGRQVDDPVLQAKLYKEATAATRTLDVQQNTFAFQMAEQRRREELQNFQYYDQLAQQEYQTYLQNRLNESQLELQGRIYGLNRWSIMNPPTATGGSGPAGPSPVVPTPTPPAAGQMPGQLAQGQFGIPARGGTPNTYQAGSLGNMAGNLLSPMGSTMGGANVVRSRYSR